MANSKRKTSRSKSPPRRRAAPVRREPLLSPETIHGIGAVLLLLTGLVLALALVQIGGPLGTSLNRFVSELFGWAGWLLPLALLWFGVLLLTERLTRNIAVGSLVVVLSLSGLLHVFAADAAAAAARGDYGGLVGHGLSTTAQYGLGKIGSTLLFLATGAIGLLVIRNRPFRIRRSVATDSPTIVTPERPVPTPPSPKPASAAGKPATPPPDFQPRVVDSAWEPPPLSLLSSATGSAQVGDTAQASRIIEQTLQNFNILIKVENINVGPSVTQYEVRPDAGVKLNQITALTNDLALALAAHPIRIEAPIPGKSTVGIEVPNQGPATVTLKQLFSSPHWKKAGALPLALGLDVSGNPVVSDLASMPHLLIAGATGAGKSVGINSILLSLLYTHSPKHLRLLLVDPKRVELTAYNDIPHLVAPVIVDAPKVVNALKWVVSEMDRRYKLFQDRQVKNIAEFNRAHTAETLPYLVVVIDELADLMQVSGKQVEATIVRIAQLARATGLHLILATQRPSTDVITGLIKANFPSRIAFTVSSATDSRIILDQGGADKLLGRGDMLFMPGNVAKPIRVQGAFVESSEVKNLTNFLKGKGTPTYDEAVTEKQSSGGLSGDSGNEGDDPLYAEAKAEVVRSRKASASFLQRRFKVGYARAARLLDMLEENGVIGPGEGAKPRDVLVEAEDLE